MLRDKLQFLEREERVKWRAEGLQQGWQKRLKLEKERTSKEQQWVGESLERVAIGLFKVIY